MALTTVLADSIPTALLAPIVLTTVLADWCPTALLARRVPTIQVAGDFTFSREPSVLVPAEVAGAGDAAAEFFGYLERFRADTDRINAR